MPPELFFFFRAMRGYGSGSRAKGKAMGSAGSGSALRGPPPLGSGRAWQPKRVPEGPVAAPPFAPFGSGVTGGGSAGTIRWVAVSSRPAPPTHGHFP